MGLKHCHHLGNNFWNTNLYSEAKFQTHCLNNTETGPRTNHNPFFSLFKIKNVMFFIFAFYNLIINFAFLKADTLDFTPSLPLPRLHIFMK